ncbi:hypothetical protein ACVINZ_004531 [Mesorhizobium jarvisii]
MRVAALAVASGMVLATTIGVAFADDLSILSKRPWRAGNQKGFIVSYRHDGKVSKGAKVYCSYASHSMYLLEKLDRGDGVKVDIDVGSEGGGGLATEIAPGYMAWAIDLWLRICR